MEGNSKLQKDEYTFSIREDGTVINYRQNKEKRKNETIRNKWIDVKRRKTGKANTR